MADRNSRSSSYSSGREPLSANLRRCVSPALRLALEVGATHVVRADTDAEIPAADIALSPVSAGRRNDA